MTKKPKILTRLRIDEVSSVDRGEGEGVRVLLMKRHNGAEQTNRIGSHFAKVDFSRLNLAEFRKAKRDKDFYKWIVDDEDDAISPVKIEKELPMNKSEQLRSIAKDYGVTRLAKFIVEEGDSHGISEHELTKMITDEAMRTRKDGETREQCFARTYTDPANAHLWKAVNIAKSVKAPYPRLAETGPRRDSGAANVDDDNSQAIQQLNELAEAQRSRSPFLSFAQAYARAFQDNPELAAKVHRRPSATTSYAFPR